MAARLTPCLTLREGYGLGGPAGSGPYGIGALCRWPAPHRDSRMGSPSSDRTVGTAWGIRHSGSWRNSLLPVGLRDGPSPRVRSPVMRRLSGDSPSSAPRHPPALRAVLVHLDGPRNLGAGVRSRPSLGAVPTGALIPVLSGTRVSFCSRSSFEGFYDRRNGAVEPRSVSGRAGIKQ